MISFSMAQKAIKIAAEIFISKQFKKQHIVLQQQQRPQTWKMESLLRKS